MAYGESNRGLLYFMSILLTLIQAEKYEIKLDKGIPKDVYMIARIYYVGTEDQEVEFYVDPAKMKRQHQLRYKSYEVQMKV